MADPLSIAGSVAGLVSIADAVFTRTYRYVRQVKNADKEIAELASGIRSLSGILHGLALVLSELEGETNETNFRLHHINSCRATLTAIETKLDCYDVTTSEKKLDRVIKRLKWPFSQTETKELIADVERHKSTIIVALSADGLRMTLQALSRQDEMSTMVQDIDSSIKAKWAMDTHIALSKERADVLAFFGKIDPRSNHESSLNLLHPLTGLWVTEGEIFQSWLQTPNSKLWLSGIPGAGKTVLAASLVEETMRRSSPKRSVAYFYCDYKDPEKQDPINVLGSLAAQLSRQSEGAFTLLQSLYNTCHPKDHPATRPKLPELTEMICEMAKSFDHVSIIVDGLDECGNNVWTVTESIASLAPEHNTSILVLSRDIGEVRECLEEHYSHLDIAARSEDLKIYVAAEIETRSRLHGRGQLRIKSTDLKEHIMKTLTDKADGMFRWVACQLDYLCEFPTDRDKRVALQSLPPTLNKTYERILAGVMERGPAIQRMVQSSLRWLIHSKDRLSIQALCEAVSITEGDTHLERESIYDVEDILSHCSSLIRKGVALDCLELAHFTVREFLEGIQPDSPYNQFSQQRENVLPQLAIISLTYLNLHNFQDEVIEKLSEWKIQQLKYPFREHAVHDWADYANGCWQDDETLTLARKLFDPARTKGFLSWFRDYLYVENIPYHGGDENEGILFSELTSLICSRGVMPLHAAAAYGLLEMCLWLLQHGGDVDEISSLGTPIHCSLIGVSCLYRITSDNEWSLVDCDPLQQERTAVLKLLIGKGANLDISYTDSFGQEFSCSKLALHANVTYGASHPLVALVEAGARLDEDLLASFERLVESEYLEYSLDQDYHEFLQALDEALKKNTQAESIRTDMLAAILRFQDPIVSRLAHKGFDGYSKVSLAKLQDIFCRAARFDQVELIEDLLRDPRLEISAKYGDTNETILHIAAEYGCLNVTEKLLSLGAEVDALTTHGLTPLQLSISWCKQSVEIIRLLLKYGASTVLGSKINGSTVWHIAAKNANKAALDVMGRVDEHITEALATAENDGFVPLVYAAKERESAAFEAILSLTNRLPEKFPGGLKMTHYVVAMNSIKLLKLVMHKGCDIAERTDDGRTALHFIPSQVDIGLVKFLIENGVSPHSAAEDGVTALHRLVRDEIAVDQGVFKLLATQNVISARANGGHSVLHYALGYPPNERWKDYSLRHGYVDLLIHEGIDVSAKDLHGNSAIQLLKINTDQPGYSSSSISSILTAIAHSPSFSEVLNDVFSWAEDAKGGALCWALLAKNETLAELLISKGADMDLYCQISADIAKWSAIHCASRAGVGLGLFRQIISKTKRIYERDSRGYCVIHVLCESTSQAEPEHLKEILDAGADFNVQVIPDGSTPLMISAGAGKANIVRYLLDQGAEIQVKADGDWQAIHFALDFGDSTTVRTLLELRTEWNSAVNVTFKSLTFRGCNLLHFAAIDSCSDNDSLKEIFRSSAHIDLNCLTGDGYSALHLAAMTGSGDIVQALLDAGANVDVESARGSRPIHSAIEQGQLSSTEILLRWGCELTPDSCGLSPEFYAMRRKDERILSILKRYQLISGRHPSNLEVIPEQNHKASQKSSMMLHLAIKEGDLALCKALVDAGASIDDSVLGCHGCTPVLWSMASRQISIARYLIEKGASTAGRSCLKAKDHGFHYIGHYAVHMACRDKSDVDLLPLLLEQDAKLGSPAFHAAVTPLHIAVACKNIAAAKIILGGSKAFDPLSATSGAETDTPSLYGSDSPKFVPWQKSAALCDRQIEGSMLEWEWLLCSGTGTSRALTTRMIRTGSALHLAVQVDGGEDILELLLTHGANIDLLDQNGASPLSIAVKQRISTTLNFLLLRGANPLLPDCFGRTPAMIAATFAVNPMVALERLHAAGDPFDHVDQDGRNGLHSARSPAGFSFLFYKGVDPYARNHKGDTPITIASSLLKFPALICNLDIDLDRCAGIISGADFVSMSAANLRLLMKRLPQHMLSEEINSNTSMDVRGTPLTRVSRVGAHCIKLLDVLIQYGASIDKELDGAGTPLMAACKSGRLDSVKYLVLFSGGKLTGTIAGRPRNAVEAARDFPHIQRWLLVGRHMEQRKISRNADLEGNAEQEIRPWSGHLSAEVLVAAITPPFVQKDSKSMVFQLAILRRRVRGKVVPVTSLRYKDFPDT